MVTPFFLFLSVRRSFVVLYLRGDNSVCMKVKANKSSQFTKL